MIPRVGIGYDVHRLGENRVLYLGGIKIQYSRGAIAHSDGDVLIHAICDALLGAAGLKDIGHYFPDNSEEFKDIDSKVLLTRVKNLLIEKEFRIGNIDSIICLQKPKIKEYIPEIVNSLSKSSASSRR